MKKLFRYYTASWIVLFLAFQASVLIVTGNTVGLSHLGASFWIAFALIDISLVGQLACIWHVFQKGIEEMFSRLPLVRASYLNLLLTTAVGILCMTLPRLNGWFSSLVALILLALEIRLVLKALAVSALMEDKAQSVIGKTSCIKTLTSRALAVLEASEGEAERKIAQNVYDALRYSDPVSCGQTVLLEHAIEKAFQAYEETPGKETGEKLVLLLKRRNELARQSKGAE